MRTVFLCALVIFAAVTGAPQENVFRVGSLSAARGERVSGALEIPDGTDAGTSLPVTIIHGAKPGPVLGLIAGNHGYEYPPILALQRVRRRVAPEALSGTIILVHVANVPSFLGRTIYQSPVDGENLNRMYPGDPTGSVSRRIAHTITTEVIDKSDVVLDVHGGDGNESLRPFVYMPVTGRRELDGEIRQLALAFGLDHIVVDRSRVDDLENSIYCDRTATSRDKPALTVESGYLGTSDEESITFLVDGIESVLRHYDMIAGSPSVVEHPVFLETTEVVTADATGVMTPHVKRGQTVSQGTPLATIMDFYGDTQSVIRAPFAGEVLYVVATPPIREGEPVAMIGARD